MSEPTLSVSDDPAGAVAALLAAEARSGSAIALTGGSSPGEAYTRAALLEPNWRKASLWWSDERCVHPSDERSNYGLAARTLLDRLSGLPEIHRIRGELPPEEAAAAYDAELDGVTLDLALLGLGPDGHIASLFPGSRQLEVADRRVTSGSPGLEPFVDRVTLTLPALLAARRIVFLVTGERKAAAAMWAFADEPTELVPASLLRNGETPIDVYLDAGAATKLP
jgi:6-phosphogluconolactonase